MDKMLFFKNICNFTHKFKQYKKSKRHSLGFPDKELQYD